MSIKIFSNFGLTVAIWVLIFNFHPAYAAEPAKSAASKAGWCVGFTVGASERGLNIASLTPNAKSVFLEASKPGKYSTPTFDALYKRCSAELAGSKSDGGAKIKMYEKCVDAGAKGAGEADFAKGYFLGRVKAYTLDRAELSVVGNVMCYGM